MQILADYNHAYSIEDVSSPVIPKYSWCYDVANNDFMLRPIRLLEETTGPTVRVHINEFEFNVPASWYILVVDLETKLVDTVQITQCTSSGYQALLMHPEVNAYSVAPIVLLDLMMKESCTHVMIARMDMMLHPVGPVKFNSSAKKQRPDLSYCCLLTPQDLGKYMHEMTAMEVIL
jgi:hypothetical protein